MGTCPSYSVERPYVMIATTAQRLWHSWIRVHGILVIACAVILGASAIPADAHALITERAYTGASESVVALQQLSPAVERDAAGDPHHACPSGCQQICASGSACHAMTMAAAPRMEIYAHSAAYQRDARGASSGLDIAPLIHPPNS